jgi:oligopeptidase B
MKKPQIISKHGIQLVDNYAWLKDKSWPKVEDEQILDFLEKENNKYKEYLSGISKLESELYNEISTRLLVDEDTVKLKKGNYSYFERIKANNTYAQIIRVDDSGKEQIILDENIEAKSSAFFHLLNYSVFDKKDLAAFNIDLKGDELYRVQVRDLRTNQIIENEVASSHGPIIWDSTGEGFYYIKLSSEWRANTIYYHRLGTAQSEDILIYKELDNVFSLEIKDSADNNFIIINTASKDSVEVRYVDKKNNPHVNKILFKREEGVLYYVDHIHNVFYIRTNKTNKNFSFYKLSEDHTQETLILEGNKDKYILNFYLYDNYLAISTREKIKPHFYILDYKYNVVNHVKFEDKTCEAKIIYSSHEEDGLIISFSSLVKPKLHLKFDFRNLQTSHVIHEQKVGGIYNRDNYDCDLVFAPSREEGIQIPISIAYRKDLFKKNTKNPLFIWGYGAYGFFRDPEFDPSIISLMDRGYVYAHAHIRGGDDLGHDWYESAKFLNKKRTFLDFVDSIEFLIKEKYVDPSKIGISGRSAGGMLIGYVLNNHANLVKAAITEVPFIDVLNTMLDDKLPLTPLEYKEWGNPNIKKYFNYILSYSPYENVKKQNYPAIYITTGLHDQRVGYWEPAKYVARVREMNIGNNPILFHTETDSGHFGGRNRQHKAHKDSKKYAFLINELK